MDSEHSFLIDVDYIRNEFEFFRKLESSANRDEASIKSFLSALEAEGIQLDDPRIKMEIETLLELTREYITISEALGIFQRNILIESAFRKRLIISKFPIFCNKVEECVDRALKLTPLSEKCEPSTYGLALCTINGQRFAVGHSKHSFAIKEACKPILYGVSVELNGVEKVHSHVGREPSGGSYNALELASNNLPHNPYINAGAIICSALIDGERSQADRFDFIVSIWKKLIGIGKGPRFNNREYLKYRANANRDYCLAYMLKEVGAFPENSNLRKTLEFYFMNLCLECDCEDLANVAATLANGGVCPFSGNRVFSPGTVRNILSLMSSCGTNDFSGQFQFEVGFPCKSGISGVLLVVIPGLVGFAIHAPEVDEQGNSKFGLNVCKELEKHFSFHMFDTHVETYKVEVETGCKWDPRQKNSNQSDEMDHISFLYAAAEGDLKYIRRMVAKGVNFNTPDYDLRSAMHLAACEGHIDVVKYLLIIGAVIDPADRFGNTPLSDAKRLGLSGIVEILSSPPNYAIMQRSNSDDSAAQTEIIDQLETDSPSKGDSPKAQKTEKKSSDESPKSKSKLQIGVEAITRSNYSITDLTRMRSIDFRSESNPQGDNSMSCFLKSLVDVPESLSTELPSSSFKNLTSLIDESGLKRTVKLNNKNLDAELTAHKLNALIDEYPVISKALDGTLVIPDWKDFCKEIERIFETCRANRSGNVASYIPQLAKVDPEKFGLSIMTVDAQNFSLGDAHEDFCVQSCSFSKKTISYCIAVEANSQEKVQEHVGLEPSGKNFNELALDKRNLPHNPLINSGAIMTCSLIRPDLSPSEKFAFICERWQECAIKYPRFSNATYLSELATADRNFCLAYLMKEKGAFPSYVDSSEALVQVLELYFQCCSIELNCDELSIVAATLANGGVNPVTKRRVFQESTVRNCLALMSSSGMYDDSGEFQFSIGIPCKSGVAGALLIVVPGVCGICVWSPRLDKLGNSVRGVEFCRRLGEEFLVHMFDNTLPGMSSYEEAGKCRQKRDFKVHKGKDKEKLVARLAYAASKGDIYEIKRLAALGIDLNSHDYDGRTALHLAVNEGQAEVVRFLCRSGVDILVKDRWGMTPLDDAKHLDNAGIVRLLERQLEKGEARLKNTESET